MSSELERKSVIDGALGAIEALRSDGAQIHSITNTVVQNFTANVLLAAGARPSMTVNPAEIADFAEHVDGLHVNLGTMDDQRMEAIRIATAMTRENAKPLVLDPVMVHVSPLRLAFAEELLANGLDILKVNSDEAKVLAPSASTCTVITGAADRITQGGLEITIGNGHPLLDKVIGSGCALGALIAALAVHARLPIEAAVGGTLWFSIAGEIAAAKSSGPRSFVPHFLDCLHELQTDHIKERMKIS